MTSLYRLVSYYDIMAIQWYASRKYSREIARVFRWVSRSGDGEIYLLLGLSLWAFEPRLGDSFMATGLVAFSMELLLYLLIKNTCKRSRPFDHLRHITPSLRPSDKFSFPSGHTAAAFVFASLIGWHYPEFSAAAFTTAILIGLSRVILCVHYPSDIVAGAVLGMGCTWGALLITGS